MCKMSSFGHAGGVGLPALPVENDPGGRWGRLLWRSPAAAALLASRVGGQSHLHAQLTEGSAHSATPDDGTLGQSPNASVCGTSACSNVAV